jgi:hypothetical protein
MTNDTIPAKPVNRNIIWIIITLLFLIGNVFLMVSLSNAKDDLERYSDAADEISNLEIELADCRVRLDDALARDEEKGWRVQSLQKQVKKLREEAIGISRLSEQTIREFKNKGLRNPEENIITDLIKHPNLIPVKSGSDDGMKFYDKKKIFVLSRNLVFAHFSDGNKGGTMILEYSITSDGRISWVPIKAYEGNNF